MQRSPEPIHEEIVMPSFAVVVKFDAADLDAAKDVERHIIQCLGESSPSTPIQSGVTELS